MLEMKLILLATLVSLALPCNPSADNSEEDQEETTTQYPDRPPPWVMGGHASMASQRSDKEKFEMELLNAFCSFCKPLCSDAALHGIWQKLICPSCKQCFDADSEAVGMFTTSTADMVMEATDTTEVDPRHQQLL